MVRKTQKKISKENEINQLVSDYINNDVRLNDEVKVIEMGNYSEIISSEYSFKNNKKCPIKKISKTEYINLNDGSGEAKNFKDSSTIEEYEKRLRRKMKNIRNLILTNFNNLNRTLFITLTYSNLMADSNKLDYDFKCFIRKIKRFFPPLKYLAVIQIQVNGSYHIHMLIEVDGDIPFNSEQIIQNKWNLGFTKTETIDNIKNVSFYMTDYMVDVPINEYPFELTKDDMIIEKEFINDGKKESIKCVKNGGITIYPNNFKIMRHSNGLNKPIVSYMNKDYADKYLLKNGYKLIDSYPMSFKSEAFNNHYVYEHFVKNDNIKKDDPECNQNHLSALPVEGNTLGCVNSTTSNAECQSDITNNITMGVNKE